MTKIRQFAREVRFKAAWKAIELANIGYPALGQEAANLYGKIVYNEGPDIRRGFAGTGKPGKTTVYTLEDIERFAQTL